MNVAPETGLAVVALFNGLFNVVCVCVCLRACVRVLACVCVCVCVDWSFRLKASLVMVTEGNRFLTVPCLLYRL